MDNTLCVAIVIRDPLVSQDIAGIFAFWNPSTVSRVFETVAEARAAPEGDFDPMLVFVAAQDGHLVLDPPDVDWLQQRGVITLDLRDRRLFPHWQHLARPFTQAHVIEAAHRLIADDEQERVEAE
ncbi:hypothetical protein So717_38840 [Roseobacter cerasinus]|uniref:Uncharacterized protein n=1 Tax=Roseobacter cerasinus TaxID=2602289 RepID=A0A640VYF3_9RHOB|nr:hypothetical protein [Roseobacter cerasinus]GFE52131.1 hypothetical protein So717_38840 [Roseobacter cerasinus]